MMAKARVPLKGKQAKEADRATQKPITPHNTMNLHLTSRECETTNGYAQSRSQNSQGKPKFTSETKEKAANHQGQPNTTTPCSAEM